MRDSSVKRNPEPILPLLLSEEVADWLALPIETFRKLQARGAGPKAIKVGGQWRYSRADVQSWLDAQPKAGS